MKGWQAASGVFKAVCASVRGRRGAGGSFPPRSRLHLGRRDLDGDDGEEIGAAPIAPTKSRLVEAFCARSGRPHWLGLASSFLMIRVETPKRAACRFVTWSECFCKLCRPS